MSDELHPGCWVETREHGEVVVVDPSDPIVIRYEATRCVDGETIYVLSSVSRGAVVRVIRGPDKLGLSLAASKDPYAHHAPSSDKAEHADETNRLRAQVERLTARYSELATSLHPDAEKWTHARLCTWTKREGRRVRYAYDKREGRIRDLSADVERLTEQGRQDVAIIDGLAGDLQWADSKRSGYLTRAETADRLLRRVQIERDALLIAGHAAYLDLPFECTRSDGLRKLLMHRDRPLSLACVDAFNTSAWLGPTGMLAQYLASPSRGNTCEVGDITALVGGIAGRVGCTLYRGACVVALLGSDRPGKPIGLSSFDGDPLEIASLIWAAADRGAELAASMRPDKDVQPLVCAVAKESNR